MKKFKTDLLHFGYINKNGRIFREDDVDLNELNNKTILGELGFPDRTEISLTNVSHKITNFEIRNGILYGEVEILSTPRGEKLEDFMNQVPFVFRPRATGHVNSDGTIDNYELYAFDAIFESDDAFDKAKLRRSKIEQIMNKLKNDNNQRNDR